MKYILVLLLLIGSFTLQAQNSEPTKSWTPDPLEDSIKKYETAAKFDKAINFANQWLEKTTKKPGRDSLDYAAALSSKANFLMTLQPRKADSCYAKVIQIRKKVLPAGNLEVAEALLKQAISNFYWKDGDLNLAKKNLDEVLDIYDKKSGLTDLKLNVYYFMVQIYSKEADFQNAEKFMYKAIDSIKVKYGNRHEKMIAFWMGGITNSMLTNSFSKVDYFLTEAYLCLDNSDAMPENTRKLIEFGLNNFKKIFENESKKTFVVPAGIKVGSHSLKSVLTEMINDSTYGKKYFDMWSDIPSLIKNKLLKRADSLLRILENNEERFLDSDFYLLLAQNYFSIKNYQESKKHLRTAIDLSSNKSTVDLLSNNLGNFCSILYYCKISEEDIELMRSFIALSNKYETAVSKVVLYHLLERDREKDIDSYINKVYANFFGNVSYSGFKGFPEILNLYYDHLLYRKGFLVNSFARWKQRIKTSGDRKLIEKFFEWETLQLKIADDLTGKNGSQILIYDSLTKKADNLESELLKRSAHFENKDDRKKRTWQEVRSKLQPGEVAIEIARFQKMGLPKIVSSLSAGDSIRKEYYKVLPTFTDTICYAALILTKTSAQPDLVILPNGNDLEGKWHKYYRNSVRLQQKDAESYKQYWQPIARKLKGIKKIWFSADGVYHKLNLGTLQNPATGKYLMDEVEIVLLGSTKDLLRKYPEESENRLACLVGNPEFQPGQTAVAGKSRSGPELSYYFKPDPNLEVAALPGTQEEIDGVAGILSKQGWEVQEYAGADASEEKVKDSYKPRVMLLSTHGFFRSDSTPGSNPLLRSGLLLSGAAKTLREGRSGEGEDGILTAYEAMNLNLDNTELVVLSACETGLGEIKNGEGVYGLQRAFQVAGARNLIMSLWKVDDAVTKDLMLAFFRNWLGEGNNQTQFAPKGPDALRTAFRKAQLEIRQKHPEPYYWGGFILLGK